MTNETDIHVSGLAQLFLEHPAWRSAARHIAAGASSEVRFSHLPGRVFHLLREGDRSLLRPGPAPDPDLAFRFTPAAIERLAAVEGDVGDFAVTLFELMATNDERLHVGFRVLSPFATLARRGYVRLLFAAGPKVIAYGAARGVRGLGELRRLVEAARSRRSEGEG